VAGHLFRAQLDVPRLDGQAPAVRHGVARVDGEVHEHLVELTRVGLDAAQVGIQGGGELDVLPDQPPQHLLHVRDEVVEVDNLRLEDLLPAEGQKLPGQARRALRRFQDLIDLPLEGIAVPQLPQRDLPVAGDDAEQIVEVVGHAAGEASHCLHLLRLHELAFEAHFVGDVVLHRHVVDDPAGVVAHGPDRRVLLVERAVLAAVHHAALPDLPRAKASHMRR
jgi:hypothetical protein